MAQLVLYRGEKYIKEETETNVILTKLEKEENGMRIILNFTKDKELSDRTIEKVGRMIYDSIVSSYYEEVAQRNQD